MFQRRGLAGVELLLPTAGATLAALLLLLGFARLVAAWARRSLHRWAHESFDLE